MNANGLRTPVIVDLHRSPIGRAHKGSLVDVRPDDLAAFVARALLDLYPEIDHASVDELICGCAYPWGEQGYNVGRNIALLAELPNTLPAHTITRLCASSLQAIRSAAQAIAVGEGKVYLVVGVESVSRVGRGQDMAAPNPRLDPDAPGDTVAAISVPMGITAENVADRWHVTREEMDRFAQRSQERAVASQENGFFTRESVRVQASGAVVEADDGPRPQSTLEGLAALQPVFRSDGRITAGNSCPLNDGAAAAIVMDEEHARSLGLRPRARILSSGVSAVAPELMGVGPIEAIRKALQRADLSINDLDAFELNEAFAAQIIPVCNEVGIDPFGERVNPNGGAIALGHPFGMTGVRIMCTLLNGLDQAEGRYGLETMCVGGGQGQAMVVERLPDGERRTGF